MPALSFLKRSKTFCKEKDKSITPMRNKNEVLHLDLEKNIQLVYNQFSPMKVQPICVLNSPSERTRGTNSIKRKFFTIESQSIYEKKEKAQEETKTSTQTQTETETLKLQPLETEPEIQINPGDFNKLLKLNTPKYILFKSNNEEKIIGNTSKKNDSLGDIYHSKLLMKILTDQKKKKYSDSKSNNCSVVSFSLNGKNNQGKQESYSGFSKFKIRKVSNMPNDGNKHVHRKNKSNVRP